LEAFPGSMASTTSPSKEGSLSVLGLEIPDLPEISAYHLEHGQPTPCWPSLLRPPIAVTRSTGILTRFPSTTPFGLALGVDSPCVDERCAGTLGLPAREFFTPFVVTHVSIRTSDTSSQLLNRPSQAYRTLLSRTDIAFRSLNVKCALLAFGALAGPHDDYLKRNVCTRSCGAWVSPVTSSAQADSTSELLRFL